jgi:hypothetical protein
MIHSRLIRRCFVIALLLLSGLCVSSDAQDSSPSPSAAPSALVANDSDRFLRDGLKAIAEESRALVGWGIALIGASVIAIASSSYFRPLNLKVRLVYLLFVPGWLCIVLSARNGESVSRRFAAASFAQNRQMLIDIGTNINVEFGYQLTYLQWGLGFFFVWLFVFILWWIFGNVPTSNN